MRSRRAHVTLRATIDRAMSLQLCGFGETSDPRRIERLAAVADGSFAWTRDADLLFWFGRITGPWFHDSSAAAAEADLVNVRPCEWAALPVLEQHVPTAVGASFRRGGRNFQRIHDGCVGPATLELWTNCRT